MKRMVIQYGLKENSLRGWVEEARFRVENANLYLRRLAFRGIKRGFTVCEHVGR